MTRPLVCLVYGKIQTSTPENQKKKTHVKNMQTVAGVVLGVEHECYHYTSHKLWIRKIQSLFISRLNR